MQIQDFSEPAGQHPDDRVDVSPLLAGDEVRRASNVDCGFFQSIRRKGGNRPLTSILDGIRSGEWRTDIEQLRELPPDEYKEAKRKLPAFLVSSSTANGSHKENDLALHTGLIQIDVDSLATCEIAANLRDKLGKDPHAVAAWLSPSGMGTKAVFAIPPVFQTHRDSFKAVQAYIATNYGVKIDSRCSDPSRLCFVSYDPGLIARDDAKPFPVVNGNQSHHEIATGGDECVGEADCAVPHPSTALLHTESCILNPAFYILHNTPTPEQLFADAPNLKRLYWTLVKSRYSNIQPGRRNKALCELVPFLYSAIAPEFIPPFIEEFYRQNAKTFNDPLDAHMSETRALLDGVAASYADALSPEEAKTYVALSEKMRTVFRICRSLAMVEHKEAPPPFFFLSFKNLGTRLGEFDMWACRAMRKLCSCSRPVVSRVKTGERRSKDKKNPKATEWQWNYELPEIEF